MWSRRRRRWGMTKYIGKPIDGQDVVNPLILYGCDRTIGSQDQYPPGRMMMRIDNCKRIGRDVVRPQNNIVLIGKWPLRKHDGDERNRCSKMIVSLASSPCEKDGAVCSDVDVGKRSKSWVLLHPRKPNPDKSRKSTT
jgi:hypothetical protein